MKVGKGKGEPARERPRSTCSSTARSSPSTATAASKSGWPVGVPGGAADASYWVSWAASPDGGLIAIGESQDQDSNVTDTIVRLLPDGTLGH